MEVLCPTGSSYECSVSADLEGGSQERHVPFFNLNEEGSRRTEKCLSKECIFLTDPLFDRRVSRSSDSDHCKRYAGVYKLVKPSQFCVLLA